MRSLGKGFHLKLELQVLAEGLKALMSLRDINFAGNQIGAKGAQASARVLDRVVPITDVNWENSPVLVCWS